MKVKSLIARFAHTPARRRHTFWPLVYMAVLFLLSSIPGNNSPAGRSPQDLLSWVPPVFQNFSHIPAFGGLAWLWCWALGAWTEKPAVRLGIAFFLSGAYAVTDEWVQAAVPGRSSSLGDLLTDLGGVMLGIWLFHSAGRKPRG